MTLVKNRVPALSHDHNAIPRHTLKSLFLSDVDRLAADGHFKGTKRIALRAFIDLMGPDCALYPSHAAVARKAKVSERTVWAALNGLTTRKCVLRTLGVNTYGTLSQSPYCERRAYAEIGSVRHPVAGRAPDASLGCRYWHCFVRDTCHKL